MSTTWSYGTGNAITMPVGTYTTVPFDLNQGTGFALPVFDYESKNNLRMAPYHRLDFSFQYLHKLSAKYDATLELSVFNAYNRANPFFYQLEQANDKVPYSEKVVKQVSLFPIVPSLSYTIRL